MVSRFLERLSEGVLICDGAMGTMLHAGKSAAFKVPEELNLTTPQLVQSVHEAYVSAGADIIEANSFGATRFKLTRAGLADKVRDVNLAAAQLAHAAAGPRTLVAGSLGPVGTLLAPYGTMRFEDARDAFKEQAEALADGGVDVFFIETMYDLNEVRAAVEGIRLACDLPIVCTLTFEKRQHTMMGVSATRAAEAFLEWGIDAFGANCGTGPDQMTPVIAALRAAAPEASIVAQPNAGVPRLGENLQPVYDLSPEEFATYAVEYRSMGVRIIGGCCGTTPDHIRAVAETLRG